MIFPIHIIWALEMFHSFESPERLFLTSVIHFEMFKTVDSPASSWSMLSWGGDTKTLRYPD